MARRPKLNAAAFCNQLARALAEDAAEFVRPFVRRHSRTLAGALQVLVAREGRSGVYLPHYWAVFVNDGRTAPFGPAKGRYLCWFRNPKDDPRLAAGYPVRVRDIRRLTADEFKHFLELNKLARAAGIEPPMIVVRQVTNSTPPTRFFDNEGDMGGWLPRAHEKAQASARAFILDGIGQDLFVNEQPLRIEF